jgi:hypothetical protein
MRRREFFAGLTGALAMPLSAQAQQTMARTIGWFSLRSADTDSEKSILAAFRRMCLPGAPVPLHTPVRVFGRKIGNINLCWGPGRAGGGDSLGACSRYKLHVALNPVP